MTAEVVDFVLRARQREAARQIASGDLKVPLRCGWCESTNIEQDAVQISQYLKRPVFRCANCGRLTSLETAHEDRRRRITTILREGVEIPLARLQRHKTPQ